MKKFRTVASFCGAIPLEVEAEDETDARTQADKAIQGMNNKHFLEALDPPLDGIEVEEIK